LLIGTGCSSLLPSSTLTVESPWQDFESAKQSYEKIVPEVTTIDDLKKSGYDPQKTPNIRIMTATEVINLFLPNPSIKKEDLDPGIQKCIESKDRCTAYLMLPSRLQSKRIGNFWLDTFTFKRNTENTGWEFRGLITIVDTVVTYRDPAGGRPFIHTNQVDVKPLGPLQEVGTIFMDSVKYAIPAL
jgi:hypothetical protein